MLCVLLVLLAGANVVLFYLTMFRRVRPLGPGVQGPMLARLNGGGVAGTVGNGNCLRRMITLYRPSLCRPGEAVGLLANCIVR